MAEVSATFDCYVAGALFRSGVPKYIGKDW